MLQDKYLSTVNGEPVTVRRHYDPVERMRNSEFIGIHFDLDDSEIVVYAITRKASNGIYPKSSETKAGISIKQFLAGVASRARHAALEEVLPPEQTAKEKKLEHYAERDLTKFVQLDGFYLGRDGGDSVMRPDEDGDSCWFSDTQELMHGADVRILIKDGVSPAAAERLIKKLSGDIGADMEILKKGSFKPPF